MLEPISRAGANCGGIAVGIWRRRRGREETERREVRVAAGQAIKFGRPAVSSCSSSFRSIWFGICWGQTQTVRRRGGLVGQRAVITQSHLFPSLLSDLWRLLCCFLARKLVKDVTFPFGFYFASMLNCCSCKLETWNC